MGVKTVCKCGRKRAKGSAYCVECRKSYARKYYTAHKEKARLYQRGYYDGRKSTGVPGRPKRITIPAWQGVPKTVLTASEIMQSPCAEKLFKKILRGELGLAL